MWREDIICNLLSSYIDIYTDVICNLISPRRQRLASFSPNHFPSPPGHTARLHFPASLAVRWGHVTDCCQWKVRGSVDSITVLPAL